MLEDRSSYRMVAQSWQTKLQTGNEKIEDRVGRQTKLQTESRIGIQTRLQTGSTKLADKATDW